MQETFREIIDEMAAASIMPGERRATGSPRAARSSTRWAPRGWARTRASVLNEWCQAHEVKNLFVADGGPFVSNADKKPTWTILALAWRPASTSPRNGETETYERDLDAAASSRSIGAAAAAAGL